MKELKKQEEEREARNKMFEELIKKDVQEKEKRAHEKSKAE